jgi:simple sugar transport system ATP-binding protein
VTPGSPPSTNLAVELRDVVKRYDGIKANDGVNLQVQRGTIHGVIGENGAGKSTAMKILFGMVRPDGGEIRVTGQPRCWNSAREAAANGLGMVHQHFMLAGPCTALDNALLGAEPTRWGFLQRRHAQAVLEELAQRYRLPVDWSRPVESLPVGMQQRLELLKLLYRRAEILILDEPTAVLTPQETQALFKNLRQLCSEGKTVLLVTHKLKEVMAYTDQVTVLRSGRTVGQLETAKTQPQELAELMVGRRISLNTQVKPGRPENSFALEVSHLQWEGLSGGGSAGDVSLSVRRGEIVGIAGVAGNGQSELLQGILHPGNPRWRTSGTVNVLGQEVTHWSTGRIRRLGVGVIPEDRLEEALLVERSVAENFLLGRQRDPAFRSQGLIRWDRVRTAAGRAMEAYGLVPRDPLFPAGRLSGGNQQKLVVARECEVQPGLLLAAEPTRGVDIGAVAQIHERLVQARDRGAGVLLVSSDLDEILALSDRICVLYEGQISAEFRRGEVTERELGLKMGGA